MTPNERERTRGRLHRGAARAVALAVVLSCGLALAQSPGTPCGDGLIDRWASHYVIFARLPDGGLRITDCPSVFRAQAPDAPDAEVEALQEISPYLLAELRPALTTLARLRPASDTLAFRQMVGRMTFSDDLCERIERVAAGLVTLSSTDPGTGRCDGLTVGCAPPVVCDCETIQRDRDGAVTGCAPPRGTCNTATVPISRGTFTLDAIW